MPWLAVFLAVAAQLACTAKSIPVGKELLAAEGEIVVLQQQPNQFYVEDHYSSQILPRYFIPDFGAFERGYRRGEQLRADARIKDPIPRIQARLVAALEEEFSPSKLRVVSRPVPLEDPQFRLFLELKTMQWGFFRSGPGKLPETTSYNFKYSARGRVIQEQDTIFGVRRYIPWWENCDFSIYHQGMPPMSQEELKANGETKLHGIVAQAGEHCAAELVAKFRAWLKGESTRLEHK